MANIWTRTLDEYTTEEVNLALEDGLAPSDVAWYKSLIPKEYYEKLETFVKYESGTITRKAFNSLPSNLQWHFNKHYNHRNDKIIG